MVLMAFSFLYFSFVFLSLLCFSFIWLSLEATHCTYSFGLLEVFGNMMEREKAEA